MQGAYIEGDTFTSKNLSAMNAPGAEGGMVIGMVIGYMLGSGFTEHRFTPQGPSTFESSRRHVRVAVWVWVKVQVIPLEIVRVQVRIYHM